MGLECGEFACQQPAFERRHFLDEVVAVVMQVSRPHPIRRCRHHIRPLDDQASSGQVPIVGRAHVVEQNILGVDELMAVRRGVHRVQHRAGGRLYQTKRRAQIRPELSYRPLGSNGRRTVDHASTRKPSPRTSYSPIGFDRQIRTPPLPPE